MRTSVCVRGDEMELTERVDGELRWGESSRRDRERDMALNTEPEPDCDGRWFPARECARLRLRSEIADDAFVALESSRRWLALEEASALAVVG